MNNSYGTFRTRNQLCKNPFLCPCAAKKKPKKSTFRIESLLFVSTVDFIEILSLNHEDCERTETNWFWSRTGFNRKPEEQKTFRSLVSTVWNCLSFVTTIYRGSWTLMCSDQIEKCTKQKLRKRENDSFYHAMDREKHKSTTDQSDSVLLKTRVT